MGAVIVKEWDGENPPNYVSPVNPGDLVRLTRGDAVIVARVVRHDGYAPGVVEFTGGLVVDLVGYDLHILERAQPAT